MGMLSHIFVDQAAARTRGSPFGKPARLPQQRDIGEIAAERRGITRPPARSTPMGAISLSVMAHAAALILVTLVVQSRTTDIAMEPATVALMFVPAPTTLPAVTDPAPAVPEPAVPPASATDQPPMPPVEPAAPPVPPTVAAVEPPAALPVPPPLPDVPTPANESSFAVASPAPVAHELPPRRLLAARPLPRPAAQPPPSPQSPSPAQAETQSVIAGSVSFAAAAQIIPPRPVTGMDTNRAPAYPELARRRGEQGRVLLRVSVAPDGTPLDVAIMATSGHQSLDAAAQTAIRQWRFIPATQAGRPVQAEAEVPVRFRLDN